ncbi:MAG TPA: crosslink repair DNA glycosylase YcaQ family protein [Gemmatimonadales bacterium]|nr:crosslink repair DNA glycosylase YcaQ family protein [Gemmatimonadales bacterium]
MPEPILHLPAARARRLWLHAQRLDTAEPFGAGPEATPAAIAHLGYLQIDTIYVIERSHHHILHTRIPSYRGEHLHQAQSIDKTVFEYWTHALSYLPTESFPFYVRQMRRDWRRRLVWFGQVSPGDLRRVVSRIRREGPITIRDIAEAREAKDYAWGSRKPAKRALEAAFYKGQVAISRRIGMLKTYELLTRHFGWDRLPRAATETERLNYLLDRALRAQGLVSLESASYLNAQVKPAMRRLIEARVRRKELVSLSVEGMGPAAHWIRPDALDATLDAPAEQTHILSPFDPLVIQRKRFRQLFEYDYRFEAYVPRDRRVFGYFVCPVLVGDRVVAALDLKTDRERQRLLVQRWHWIGRGGARAFRKRVEEALDRFERFQLGATAE